MATIEILVDESTLKEAEKALHLIGMDVQIAVGIFLRRVALEKGFPLTMTAIVDNEKEYDEEDQEVSSEEHKSAKITIIKAMVDEVWLALIKYHKGLGEISKLSDDVSEISGMSRGSAFIYLTILSNLLKGENNTRTMKFQDLEYYMNKVYTELGKETCKTAVQSLKLSIPYWRKKVPGSFAEKVESLCRRYDDMME